MNVDKSDKGSHVYKSLSFWGPRRLKTKDDYLTPLEKMFPVVAT